MLIFELLAELMVVYWIWVGLCFLGIIIEGVGDSLSGEWRKIVEVFTPEPRKSYAERLIEFKQKRGEI